MEDFSPARTGSFHPLLDEAPPRNRDFYTSIFFQDSEELDPSESSEELEPGVLWCLAQKPTCVRNLLVIFDIFDGFIHGAIVLQKLLCQLNLEFTDKKRHENFL